MPRKASNYANGIQYKIVCKDPAITDCYNGSCVSLKDRKKTHKQHSLNPNDKAYNFKVYRFIREHGGWDNWTFLQLEESPCKSKQELVLRERHWFDIIKPTLNMVSPMITPEEKKIYRVEYYADNRAEIIAHKKQFYADNKDEISVKNQQVYADNRDAFSAKNQQYYADNRVKILEKLKEKVRCECGCITTKSVISRHLKSKKHLNLMNQLK